MEGEAGRLRGVRGRKAGRLSRMIDSFAGVYGAEAWHADVLYAGKGVYIMVADFMMPSPEATQDAARMINENDEVACCGMRALVAAGCDADDPRRLKVALFVWRRG